MMISGTDSREAKNKMRVFQFAQQGVGYGTA